MAVGLRPSTAASDEIVQDLALGGFVEDAQVLARRRSSTGRRGFGFDVP